MARQQNSAHGAEMNQKRVRRSGSLDSSRTPSRQVASSGQSPRRSGVDVYKRQAKGVRIEAPIPGKSAIGIEVPNKTQQTVYLRELIDSEEFRTSKSKISAALGKDISGERIVIDLARMPHLLIAGATGTGKSVCCLLYTSFQ